MTYLAVSAACFAAFLLFELFALSMERLSIVRLRSLVEEEPAGLGRVAGKDHVPALRVATRVAAQGLTLGGFWTLIRGFGALRVPSPWLTGGLIFLAGWLGVEVALMRLVSRRSPEAVLKAIAPAFLPFGWLVRPILPGLQLWIGRVAREEGPASDEQIQAYIEVGREEGILEKGEDKLLLSIVDFGDTRVKAVMTPRPDIVALEEGSSVDEAARAFAESKHSRLPLYRGTIEHVTGIVHLRDAFEAYRAEVKPPLARLARPADFVPETQRIAELLPELQRRRRTIAIVVDEYGSVSGLVTMEDLLEEIVGEIEEEHEGGKDRVLPLPDGSYSLAGRTHVHVLQDLFGRGPEEADFETVGGFLAARLGRIPRVGEIREEGGLRFTVEAADRRRVLRVKVEPSSREAEPANV